jgi:hypothetical protein
VDGGAYSEFPHGDVGFPKGDSPEEFLANMIAFLEESAAKLPSSSDLPPKPCSRLPIARCFAALNASLSWVSRAAEAQLDRPKAALAEPHLRYLRRLKATNLQQLGGFWLKRRLFFGRKRASGCTDYLFLVALGYGPGISHTSHFHDFGRKR